MEAKRSAVEYAPKEEQYLEGSNKMEGKNAEEKCIFVQGQILRRKNTYVLKQWQLVGE